MYFVLKMDDIRQFLSPWFHRMLRAAARRIGAAREKNGKRASNHYIIINRDEPWIDQIISVMRRNGVSIK